MRNILGGNRADISIVFKRRGDVVAYKPGETLQATVEIQTESEINCRDVRVSVGWHTEGKGDRSSQDVYTEPMGITTLTPGRTEQFNFTYQLPQTPYSYRGQLINIIWQVTVTVDIALMPDIEANRVFVLQPYPDAF